MQHDTLQMIFTTLRRGVTLRAARKWMGRRNCSRKADTHTHSRKKMAVMSRLPSSPASRALAWSVLLFMVGLLGALISWPIMDILLIPRSISRRLSAANSRDKSSSPEVRRAAALVKDLILKRWDHATEQQLQRNVLCILADDPVFASQVLRHALEELKQEGHPCYHASLMAMVCPATLLYGMLYECYHSSSFIIAYVKFLNAAAMAMTMNQDHAHTTYILFEQFLGQMRIASEKVSLSGDRSVLALSNVDVPIRESRNPSNEAARALPPFLSSLFQVFMAVTAPPTGNIMVLSGDAETLLSVQNRGMSKGEPNLLSDTLLARTVDHVDSADVEVVYLERAVGKEETNTLQDRWNSVCDGPGGESHIKLCEKFVHNCISQQRTVTYGELERLARDAGIASEKLHKTLDLLLRQKLVRRVAGTKLAAHGMPVVHTSTKDVELELVPRQDLRMKKAMW